jgi:AbrB family looped-hinge helix DNA binding protein
MPYVRVKQKYQVTIPAAIRKKIDLHEGDTLEAIEQDGKIVLVPQEITDRNRRRPQQKPSLLSLLGSNEGSGLYTSAKNADEYLRNLRDEWN